MPTAADSDLQVSLNNLNLRQFPLRTPLRTNMLPNHPQRLHRRQNSTPSAFSGVKKPSVPTTARPSRAAGHRRGLSLDTRHQNLQKMVAAALPPARQGQMVSICTNDAGLGNPSQHDLLRETQQQSTPARPGSEHRHHQDYFSSSENTDIENYLTPYGTPQTTQFDFDMSTFDSQPPMGHYGQIDLSPAHFASCIPEDSEFDLFVHDSAVSTPIFPNFYDSPPSQGYKSEGTPPSPRRSFRRVSNGIKDRVEKFEGFGMENWNRPITPPDVDFPPTPMETPQQAQLRHQEAYLEEAFEDAFGAGRPRPTIETAPQDLTTQQQAIDQQQPSERLVQDAAMFGAPVQQSPSPSATDMVDPRGAMALNFTFPSQLSAQSIHGLQAFPSEFQAPSGPSGCGHRRSQSMVSARSVSQASIADLDVEQAKTETGITIDDINKYISGPDPAEGKWKCTFPTCDKTFGRKENIKSHVQTHLGDRAYECPVCLKRFVRQHDLKRHAKIHTGNKPYTCDCLREFARHDALTRHRQRGMCIGAFDGIVRKPKTRGRPRKNRPEMDERLEKSEATRRKNNMSISSTSSVSAYTDSSAAPSPANDPTLPFPAYSLGFFNDGFEYDAFTGNDNFPMDGK